MITDIFFKGSLCRFFVAVSKESRTPTDFKSKKHKHKRPRRDPTDDENTGDLVIAEEIIPSPPKLKTLPLKSPSTSNVNNKKRKKRDSASSDEERWLTAIESGKLEDVDDELKKIKPKDPSLMTARQRAMYDRGIDGSPGAAPTLMSLPTGYKEKVMTAEAIQKAAIKSQKRKQLADEKREKDKKKTMDRLLKKQESKAAKVSRVSQRRNIAPVLIYQQNVSSTTLKLPPDYDFPLNTKKEYKPPELKYCIMGCGNLRKYCCSRTGAPLCSLECYKKNIASRIL